MWLIFWYGFRYISESILVSIIGIESMNHMKLHLLIYRHKNTEINGN